MKMLEGIILRFLSLSLICISPTIVKSQNKSNTTTITLKEVSLKAPKTQTPSSLLPISFSNRDLSSFQGIYQQLNLQEYLGSVPGLFTQNANNCRLSVHTHNATTFIETLEANFPTILYLNKRYYELRDSSKGIFDELMRVKIFFDNIEETSCFINQNYNDIEKWWYDDSLQKVRKK